MLSSTTSSYIAQQLLTELPDILVCIGGIIVAATLWRRAPSSSLYVAVGCAVTLFLLLLHPLAWQVARHAAEGTALTPRGINIGFAVLWSIERSAFAVLLLFAVYSGRPRS